MDRELAGRIVKNRNLKDEDIDALVESMSDEEIDLMARLIVKAFEEKELLKMGNRSYLNAFRYPASRSTLRI